MAKSLVWCSALLLLSVSLALAAVSGEQVFYPLPIDWPPTPFNSTTTTLPSTTTSTLPSTTTTTSSSTTSTTLPPMAPPDEERIPAEPSQPTSSGSAVASSDRGGGSVGSGGKTPTVSVSRTEAVVADGEEPLLREQNERTTESGPPPEDVITLTEEPLQPKDTALQEQLPRELQEKSADDSGSSGGKGLFAKLVEWLENLF